MSLQPLLTDWIRETSTRLPPDVERVLRARAALEPAHSHGAFIFQTILDNVELAARQAIPICQDTGALSFWIDAPRTMDLIPLYRAIRDAVAEATRQGWLRQNTIDEPEGRSLPDNLSEHHPVIHTQVEDREDLRIRLLMKGGGSENMSRQYSLPDTEIGAARDLEGVRRCLLDAVWRAQGNGCAPGILGVCIGGDRATAFEQAKQQLLRPLDDTAPHPDLAALEQRVLDEVQTLGIGPMGMSGKTTLLGVKIGAASRLPASYFVTVAYLCWAARRSEIRIPPHSAVHGSQVFVSR